MRNVRMCSLSLDILLPCADTAHAGRSPPSARDRGFPTATDPRSRSQRTQRQSTGNGLQGMCAIPDGGDDTTPIHLLLSRVNANPAPTLAQLYLLNLQKRRANPAAPYTSPAVRDLENKLEQCVRSGDMFQARKLLDQVWATCLQYLG